MRPVTLAQVEVVDATIAPDSVTVYPVMPTLSVAAVQHSVSELLVTLNAASAVAAVGGVASMGGGDPPGSTPQTSAPLTYTVTRSQSASAVLVPSHEWSFAWLKLLQSLLATRSWMSPDDWPAARLPAPAPNASST